MIIVPSFYSTKSWTIVRKDQVTEYGHGTNVTGWLCENQLYQYDYGCYDEMKLHCDNYSRYTTDSAQSGNVIQHWWSKRVKGKEPHTNLVGFQSENIPKS